MALIWRRVQALKRRMLAVTHRVTPAQAGAHPEVYPYVPKDDQLAAPSQMGPG